MEYYLIIARSVTYAQRIERVLSRAGIRTLVFRAPLELTKGEGCAYAIRLIPDEMPTARQLLLENGLYQVRLLKTDVSGVWEVAL